MTTYIILYLIIFYVFISSLLIKKTSIHFILISILLAVFSMFRYKVGVDFESYTGFINYIAAGHSSYMEPGFEYMVRVLSYFDATSQLTFAVVGGLTIMFFAIFIKYFSRFEMLSLFLFFTLSPFYLATFNGIRQFLAISIFAFSIKFIYEKHLIKYVFFILLASTLHITAILMLPFYFILNIKVNKKILILYTAGGILLLKFIEQILFFLNLSPIYLGRGGNDIQNEENLEAIPIQGYIIIIIFIVTFYYRNRLMKLNPRNKIFINMLSMSSIISLTPLFINLLAADILRMTSYFSFSLLIIIPELIRLTDKKALRVLLPVSVVLVSSAYYFLTIYNKGVAYRLVPYEFNFILFE